MKRLDIPFNIKLLQLQPEHLRNMRKVTSLDTFDGATKNFHPDGLFSTQTFGVSGSDARYVRYAYIDLKITILHPIIFRALVKLKSFYQDIMSGREFAKWNDELSDFEKSTAIDGGETGYQFFMEHWRSIQFEQRPSVRREMNIAVIDKYGDQAELGSVVVMPAGYRDLEIDENGRESSDEINSLYYKLVAISNTINTGTVKISPEAYNQQRYSLQLTFNEVYDTIERLIEGKKNLMMGKWAARKIFNGTRNVITSMNVVSERLGAKNHPGFHNTLVGIYQTIKGILPISMHRLHTGFLSKVFTNSSSPALLTNPKTLMSERVSVDVTTFDSWMTREGLEKIITRFQDTTIRHNPIMVEGHYLGLMYRGHDGTFKLIHGIDELPSGRKPEDCKPISYAELFYCAIYEVANKYPVYVTRYPVAGVGSVYPSLTYLKSTIKSEVRVPLNEYWEPEPEKTAYEFPTPDSDFFNSMSPHSTRLGGLKADFDGDTASGNFAYSNDAIEEVNEFFNSRHCYIGTDGNFVASLETDTLKYVLHCLTS